MQTTQPGRRPPTTTPASPKTHDTDLVDEMNELLDQIDHVLEENALETTRAFAQRPGE